MSTTTVTQLPPTTIPEILKPYRGTGADPHELSFLQHTPEQAIAQIRQQLTLYASAQKQ